MARAFCLPCNKRFNVLDGEAAVCPSCNTSDDVTVRPAPGSTAADVV